MLRAQFHIRIQQYRIVQGIFQFANVPRPRIVLQQRKRLIGKSLRRAPEPARVKLHEMVRQNRDILPALA